MQELIRVKVGMAAVILGIVGVLFGVGAVEASIALQDLITGLGISAVSLMIMYVGVELVKE